MDKVRTHILWGTLIKGMALPLILMPVDAGSGPWTLLRSTTLSGAPGAPPCLWPSWITPTPSLQYARNELQLLESQGQLNGMRFQAPACLAPSGHSSSFWVNAFSSRGSQVGGPQGPQPMASALWQ